MQAVSNSNKSESVKKKNISVLHFEAHAIMGLCRE